MAGAISVHDLTVSYRDAPVLWDIDLEVPTGVLAAVVGPNGAGKTTLLKVILGLIRPVAGGVRILGDDIRRVRRRIAYVPQRNTVDWEFPVSVRDVVLMGTYRRLGWFRRPGRQERAAADRAMERMGIADLADRQIAQLSGGQQQRVFLSRALVQEADLFFMDEPFQGVDAVSERTIVELLRELRSAGKTAIVVHHDLATAAEFFDWAVLLNVRKVADGPVDTTLSDENLRIAYGRRPISVAAAPSAGD